MQQTSLPSKSLSCTTMRIGLAWVLRGLVKWSRPTSTFPRMDCQETTVSYTSINSQPVSLINFLLPSDSGKNKHVTQSISVWTAFRCDGKLRGFLPCWSISSSGYPAISTFFALLPSSIVLQPALQLYYDDRSEWISRQPDVGNGRTCIRRGQSHIPNMPGFSDYTDLYFKSVKVDGKPYKSNCFLEWDVFQNGSIIELQLTNNINVTCGSGPGALPPSLSTGGFRSG